LPAEWTLSHYHAALGHYLTVPAIVNSLKYASFSTVVDLLLGVAIAYVVVRTDLPARGLLDTLAMLPLAVPGLVLAFGYISMTQDGRLFAFLNPARDPTILLVIAYAVRRLPYVVRSAIAGLQQTSVQLEEAAQNLGASPLRTLRRITLPLIAANVLAGGLLAFSFAMLEVSDSLILAQKQQDFPITKAIYELFQLLGEGRFVASALGVWAMVFLGLTILATSRIMGKKLGALFRV
jgi:iron(III) transport system permease protein